MCVSAEIKCAYKYIHLMNERSVCSNHVPRMIGSTIMHVSLHSMATMNTANTEPNDVARPLHPSAPPPTPPLMPRMPFITPFFRPPRALRCHGMRV